MFKIQDVPDIRPPEFINRLIVVAYDTQISVFGGQKAHQFELSHVGVLILVHHNVLESFLIIVQDLGLRPEQFHGLHDQVVEIQSVIFLKAVLISLIDIGDHLFPGIAPCHLLILFRGDEPVLGPGDGRQGLSLFEKPGICLQLFINLFHHRLLIVPVINGKTGFVSQISDVPSENPDTGGMEGADPHAVCSVFYLGIHPLPHLSCRLVGKCNGQDIPGIHLLFPDQVSDPVGQHSGLA